MKRFSGIPVQMIHYGCVYGCMSASMGACQRVQLHACLRAYVHACERACVRACMRALVYACMCMSVHLHANGCRMVLLVLRMRAARDRMLRKFQSCEK